VYTGNSESEENSEMLVVLSYDNLYASKKFIYSLSFDNNSYFCYNFVNIFFFLAPLNVIPLKHCFCSR